VTAAEKDRGWVEFTCPDHGFLVATTARATVVCKCQKRAVPYRSGRKVAKATLSRLRRSPEGST
jgi:hypothetical protein